MRTRLPLLAATISAGALVACSAISSTPLTTDRNGRVKPDVVKMGIPEIPRGSVCGNKADAAAFMADVDDAPYMLAGMRYMRFKAAEYDRLAKQMIKAGAWTKADYDGKLPMPDMDTFFKNVFEEEEMDRPSTLSEGKSTRYVSPRKSQPNRNPCKLKVEQLKAFYRELDTLDRMIESSIEDLRREADRHDVTLSELKA